MRHDPRPRSRQSRTGPRSRRSTRHERRAPCGHLPRFAIDPIAVSLASQPDIQTWVLVDERAAGFFALGMARQLNAAGLSTSGTAAANFLPSVIEARLSRIPLLVLTADRPPDCATGAQRRRSTRSSSSEPTSSGLSTCLFPWLTMHSFVMRARPGKRAVQTERSHPAGPVHLNLPFREPLLPADLRPSWPRPMSEHTRHSDFSAQAEPGQLVPTAAALDELASQIAREPRGIIVCGPGEAPGLAAAAAALNAACGYPILADPLSGLRFAHTTARASSTPMTPFSGTRRLWRPSNLTS